MPCPLYRHQVPLPPVEPMICQHTRWAPPPKGALSGAERSHMATKLLDDVEASSAVIPAEATGPERVADARERAYGPGRESRKPVTRSASNNIEVGGLLGPGSAQARRSRARLAGMTTICDRPAFQGEGAHPRSLRRRRATQPHRLRRRLRGPIRMPERCGLAEMRSASSWSRMGHRLVMMSLGGAEPSAKTVLIARSTKTKAVSLPRSNASFTSGEPTNRPQRLDGRFVGKTVGRREVGPGCAEHP